jgi:hypothetical protein
MESDEITGRPDDTWTAEQKAWYEAMKAKALAEMSDEPDWLNQPTVPFDDVIELLDRLEREATARGDKA